VVAALEPDPIGADTLRVPVRSVLLATLMLLLAAPAAHAATTVTLRGPDSQTEFGESTTLRGTVLTDGGPAAEVPVQLEGRPYPYDRDFAPVATAKTDAEGAFRITRNLKRNWQFRAVAAGVTSRRARVYVLPATKLSYKPRTPTTLRFTQRYRVPRDVRLEQPTIFYFGPSKSESVPRVASGKLKRIGAGRYRSTATVRLPPEWEGAFRYATCFRYSGGGMGNPRTTCPKRFRF
jgi:hypothetical protein